MSITPGWLVDIEVTCRSWRATQANENFIILE